jgi:hypothetical protein
MLLEILLAKKLSAEHVAAFSDIPIKMPMNGCKGLAMLWKVWGLNLEIE